MPFTKRKYHVAYLAKSWKLLDKILDGEKTIESRWYVNRTRPWNGISKGDTIYLKETGEPVRVKAKVGDVLFFDNLNKQKIKAILEEYDSRICLSDPDSEFFRGKNYCILVFLKDVERIAPFDISKKGFGNACAWITVDDIEGIKKLR